MTDNSTPMTTNAPTEYVIPAAPGWCAAFDEVDDVYPVIGWHLARDASGDLHGQPIVVAPRGEIFITGCDDLWGPGGGPADEARR